jgi:hypothetical protein
VDVGAEESLLRHRVPSLGILSRAGIRVQAVRRYGSGQIGYRAMYVRIGNPMVCSTPNRLFVCLFQLGYSR